LRESEGRTLTSEAKPNEQDALGFAAGLGEYGEVTYTNSPDCLLDRGSFRSFGYASLVRTLPSLSRKGSALDPAGNQSEMTLVVIGWTPALAFAR